jgi:hypothetical protein
LSEFERLKEKASNGSYEKFVHVMSKVPAADPNPDWLREIAIAVRLSLAIFFQISNKSSWASAEIS